MPNRVQRTCDKTVVVLMVLLLLMGLVTLFSATYYQKAATGDALAAVKKQLIGVALCGSGEHASGICPSPARRPEVGSSPTQPAPGR